MTYLTAILIVIVAAVTAGLGGAWVGRMFAVEVRRSRHDVGAAVFAQIGILFSVLLAFVFSEVWGEYNTAAQAISAECGALHGAALIAKALPSEAGAPLIAATVHYDETVVNVEWPAMRRRASSPQAVLAFEGMIVAAAKLAADDPGDAALRGHILGLLTDAHAARETRIFQVGSAVPPAVWTVLDILATMLILCVVFAGVEYPVHIAISAGFAACIVLVLVLVAMLDYPFEGSLSLDSGWFVQQLGQMRALAAAP